MSFISGFIKTASEEDEGVITPQRAVAIGTGVGAAKNIAHDIYLNKREKQLPNTKSLHHFRKKLKPGDVLLLGSTPRHAGGTNVEDLPKPLRKFLRKAGISGKTELINNSTLLTAIGGGGKYHAGIYLGKGRVGHMTTDTGAVTEWLKDVAPGQNVSAYRFSDLRKGEARSAAQFARRSAKEKTPYQSFARYAPQAISNVISPRGISACRKRGGGMVCNTLPIRAYHHRKFTPQGEWTYTGDLRRAKNLHPVARRDVVKIPWHLKTRNILGQASKGLKWGLGAGAGALLLNKFRKKEQN